ncbi:MAG: ATP-dependent Clp protease ATP-binding subunit ClpX [Pseudomonadota bacterium]
MSSPPPQPSPIAACSFCSKPRYDVATLISGEGGYICDGCIRHCADILNGDAPEAAPTIESPRALLEHLSSRLIGQEAAKRQLAVSVFHHQYGKRGAGSSRLLRKQNLLFLGPTGSGKTYMMQSLAKSLNIPMVTVSATAYTQTGYVGDEVESMLRYLLERCDNNIERAESGIVFIDEIDKIATTGSGPSETQFRDVSGAGVQQDLLTMMEGTVVRLPAGGGPRHLTQDFIEIDTSNIMFVASGAFVGIEDIVEQRLYEKTKGESDEPEDEHLKRQENKLRQQVLIEDLIEFGLLPEFAGRFAAYVPFDHLLIDDLLAILRNPNGSPVCEYQRYFQAYGVELVVDEGALLALAEQAEALATGARGLRSIVDRCFRDVLFELPEWRGVRRVVFGRDAALGTREPGLEH